VISSIVILSMAFCADSSRMDSARISLVVLRFTRFPFLLLSAPDQRRGTRLNIGQSLAASLLGRDCAFDFISAVPTPILIFMIAEKPPASQRARLTAFAAKAISHPAGRRLPGGLPGVSHRLPVVKQGKDRSQKQKSQE
jgi:hypothetical protein